MKALPDDAAERGAGEEGGDEEPRGDGGAEGDEGEDKVGEEEAQERVRGEDGLGAALLDVLVGID